MKNTEITVTKKMTSILAFRMSMIPFDTDWDEGKNEAIARLRRPQPRVRLARCDQVVVVGVVVGVDVFEILGVVDLVSNYNQEFTWPGATKLLIVLMFSTFLVLVILSGIATKSLLGQVRLSCCWFFWHSRCWSFLTFLVLIFSGTTTKSLLGQVRSSCGCCW